MIRLIRDCVLAVVVSALISWPFAWLLHATLSFDKGTWFVIIFLPMVTYAILGYLVPRTWPGVQLRFVSTIVYLFALLLAVGTIGDYVLNGFPATKTALRYQKIDKDVKLGDATDPVGTGVAAYTTEARREYDEQVAELYQAKLDAAKKQGSIGDKIAASQKALEEARKEVAELEKYRFANLNPEESFWTPEGFWAWVKRNAVALGLGLVLLAFLAFGVPGIIRRYRGASGGHTVATSHSGSGSHGLTVGRVIWILVIVAFVAWFYMVSPFARLADTSYGRPAVANTVKDPVVEPGTTLEIDYNGRGPYQIIVRPHTKLRVTFIRNIDLNIGDRRYNPPPIHGEPSPGYYRGKKIYKGSIPDYARLLDVGGTPRLFMTGQSVEVVNSSSDNLVVLLDINDAQYGDNTGAEHYKIEGFALNPGK